MQLNQRYVPAIAPMQCSKQCILSLNDGLHFTPGLQFHSHSSADHCLEHAFVRRRHNSLITKQL